MLTRIVAVLIGLTSLSANAWLFAGLGSTIIQQVFMALIGGLLQVTLYLFAAHLSHGNVGNVLKNGMRLLFPLLFLVSVGSTVAFLEMDAQRGVMESHEYTVIEDRRNALLELVETRKAIAERDLITGYRQRALEALEANEMTMEEVAQLNIKQSQVTPNDKLGALVALIAENVPLDVAQTRLLLFLSLALCLDVSGLLTVSIPLKDKTVNVKEDTPEPDEEQPTEIETIAAKYRSGKRPPPVRLVMRENNIGYPKAKAVVSLIKELSP